MFFFELEVEIEDEEEEILDSKERSFDATSSSMKSLEEDPLLYPSIFLTWFAKNCNFFLYIRTDEKEIGVFT